MMTRPSAYTATIGSRPRSISGVTKPPSQLTRKITLSGSTGLGEGVEPAAPADPTQAPQPPRRRRARAGRARRKAARNTGVTPESSRDPGGLRPLTQGLVGRVTSTTRTPKVPSGSSVTACRTLRCDRAGQASSSAAAPARPRRSSDRGRCRRRSPRSDPAPGCAGPPRARSRGHATLPARVRHARPVIDAVRRSGSFDRDRPSRSR